MEKMQNNFNISIVHPTCRPKIARETRDRWLDLSSDPDSIEYLLCSDSNCTKFPETKIITEFISYGGASKFYGPVTTVNCFEDNSLVRKELSKTA